MALDAIVRGVSSGTGQEVDTNNNAKVNLPTAVAQAGFGALAGEYDDGTVTGARAVNKAAVTDNRRVQVSAPTMMMSKTFLGSLNSGYWHQIATTQTAASSVGIFTLNNGNVTTASTGSGVQSAQVFPVLMGASISAEWDVYLTSLPVVNNTAEWGVFNYATSQGAATDGAYFTFNAAGEFRCVLMTNSVPSQSPTLSAATLAPINVIKNYRIVLSDDGASFFINNVRVAFVARPAGNGFSTLNTSLFMSARTYTAPSAPSTATQLKLGAAAVWVEEALSARPYVYTLGGQGGHGAYSQDGNAIGQTAAYTNNTAPTPAVPTNTTAALGAGLGGHFLATATAVVNTDLIISSYLNPVASSSNTGRNLYINAVWIETYVQTALTAGGQNIVWYLSVGTNAISEATAESATVKARRVIPLGVQTVAAAATALTQAARIQVALSGVVVYPNEYVKVCCRYVGTAASAGAYGHLIGIDSLNE
jgi:hypothetical protein